MAIAIVIPGRDLTSLQRRLQEALPDEEIVIYPDIDDPSRVEAAIVWDHPSGIWAELPKLKMVCSFGAGVDHLVFDDKMPPHIRVTRIVDPDLTQGMSRYVCMAVLNFHKNFYHFHRLKEQKKWGRIRDAQVPVRPGLLGLGVLGADMARKLAGLGFEVYGYSRSPKQIEGVHCMSEKNGEWSAFLNAINALICVLPLTKDTYGILNRDLFDQLPDGSYLINVGRGQQLVDTDLIEAIEKGKIRGACLDVFHPEPLPADHPFWEMPEVMITPHVASVTNPDTAVEQILENLRRFREGRNLLNLVNLGKGY